MKQCSKCGAEKPLDEFYVSKGRVYPSCKACHNERQAEYRDRNRERLNEDARRQYRERVYGISQDTIDALLEIQGGLCAICEKRPAVWIDHDHKTGLVRGILCKPCNWALGHFEDDRGTIRRALLYLGYYEAVEIDQIHSAITNGH